jgi:1,4-dihydroxy-2-naphthoate octaprenyltransferase
MSVQSWSLVVKIAFIEAECKQPSALTPFIACRPKFLTASAAPVLVGSALGYAAADTFSPVLFILALLAIMALHAGANMANDYFDHLSGNDWANRNPTPFSGGSRFIQQGVLSPKAILLAALLALTTGSIIGLIIVLLTQSLFILVVGLIGLLGGFFYTAPPLRLGYRGIGEFVIAILFGLLPVYASYHLQARTIDILPLLPACIVGLLIFLVILVNEFADFKADAAVNKKTLVVLFGVPTSIWIYRIALVASFVITAVMLIYRLMFFAGLFYLFTLPMAVLAARSTNVRDLTTPGRYRASQITVLLHSVGCVVLAAGFILSGLRNMPT